MQVTVFTLSAFCILYFEFNFIEFLNRCLNIPNFFFFYFSGSFGRTYMGSLTSAESGEEFKVIIKTVTGACLL